jgi:hypothetical protein
VDRGSGGRGRTRGTPSVDAQPPFDLAAAAARLDALQISITGKLTGLRAAQLLNHLSPAGAYEYVVGADRSESCSGTGSTAYRGAGNGVAGWPR